MVALYSRNNGSGYRLIYPDGRVEYNHINPKGDWSYSCLSRSSRKGAVRAMRKYDRVNGYKPAKFLGYL